MTTIDLGTLTLDPKLQPRERLDEQLVEEYAEAMGRGDVFPPIRVVQNGKAAWLVDGFHRVAGAKRLGVAELSAEITHGTYDDAFDVSLTVNRAHGMRRTHADVQNAIRRALLSSRWVKRTDRTIADHIGCNHGTVTTQRERMESVGEIRQLTTLEGNDGKSYPRAKAAAPLVVQNIYTLTDWTGLSAKDQARVLKVAADLKDTTGFNKQDTDNIEWAKWSWNPITGCKHNCPYCYARDIAQRFYTQGFEPAIHPGRLRTPQRVAVPDEAAHDVGYRNVFTCSMADLFGRWVPDAWIHAVIAAMRDAPQWNFLLLTKFPVRLSQFEFPDNAWVGTSVDCQARVANAERAFAKVRAKVKWLSCEPLIEPLTFSNLSVFQWVVIGGASSSTQTPSWQPPRAWVTELRDAAWAAGCQVYEKTNLLRRWRQYPGHDEEREPTAAPPAFHYLKQAASRDEQVEG